MATVTTNASGQIDVIPVSEGTAQITATVRDSNGIIVKTGTFNVEVAVYPLDNLLLHLTVNENGGTTSETITDLAPGETIETTSSNTNNVSVTNNIVGSDGIIYVTGVASGLSAPVTETIQVVIRNAAGNIEATGSFTVTVQPAN